MSSDQNFTANNSEVFVPSPHQNISTKKIFNLGNLDTFDKKYSLHIGIIIYKQVHHH